MEARICEMRQVMLLMKGAMELPAIVEKMYELNVWLLQRVSKFPKDQRFILGDRLANKGLDIKDKLIEAALTKKGDEKSGVLNEVNLELEQFRYLLRLANDQKRMSRESWFFCSKNLLEIGKMLGGWIKNSLA